MKRYPQGAFRQLSGGRHGLNPQAAAAPRNRYNSTGELVGLVLATACGTVLLAEAFRAVFTMLR